MKKAVFISFLIHALLFLLAVCLLPEPVRNDVYRVISVRVNQAEAPQKVKITEVSEPLEPPEAVKAVPDKKEDVQESLTLLPQETVTSEKTEQIKPESVVKEPSFPEIIPDSIGLSSGDSDIIVNEQSPEVVMSGQDEMIESKQSGTTPQDDTHINPLDISWADGIDRTLLNGDSPQVDVSRNSLLMDTVRILFVVQKDGNVSNVRIMPPGSNSFQVDRQLREWANLLLFEKLKDGDQSAEGVVTINLKARMLSLP